MFASICCNIITINAIQNAFDNPPVITVINMLNPTATIAPKYGIILNNPIINPNNIEYLTPIILIATVTKIPTTTASINCPLINLKNIYDAIKTTKAVYPDVIAKELIEFKEIFKDELKIEGTILD